ncbi:MAG: hypothetical protein HN793_02110 [Rhodospirillaceae bacterium]|nr:hypothetical protein [Rhodospirillaceae bacterium]
MGKSTKAESGMHSTDYTMDSDALVWWTTPVVLRRFKGVAAVNSELKSLILDRASSDKNIQKSNQGGWHSGEDLLTWGGPAIAQLQAWIVTAFKDLTEVTSDGQVYTGKIELNAWANLNRRGDYNTIHTHPACVWSGVYYVDVGEPPSAEHPKSGAIEFLDPRAGAEMVAIPGLPFGEAKSINPETGQLIVFPSWLKHMVHPYWGEGDRITIAFNIRIRPEL